MLGRLSLCLCIRNIRSTLRARVAHPDPNSDVLTLFNIFVRGFDYLVVVDFEATCEEKNVQDYPHEIIEFPAVLIDVLR